MTTPASRFNLRAVLRFALLAAAESCWLYALVLTLGALGGFARVVSPFGIFIVYMAGLGAGRFLPRLPQKWRVLQILAVGIAIVAILIAARVGLYADVGIADFSWLPTYSSRVLSFFERVNADALSTFVLVLAFIRALNLAPSPLTLWVVGFQFRLGIVILFLLALVAGFTTRVDFIFWIFMYFAFFLISIALARIEDAGQLGALGGRWALVMLTMLAVILLVGFMLTQLLTLETVNALFAMLAPVAFVVQVVLLILVLPLLYLLDLLFQQLLPLFQWLGNILARFLPPPPTTAQETPAFLETITQQLESLMPYLRLIGVLLVLLGLGWLIARALHRRMNREEQEMFAREALGENDRKQKENPRRASRTRTRRREIHAENVRRIYAALQAQAETLGLKRRDAETPHEFLPRLTARFPEAHTDLQTITNAYVAVHYAQQHATEVQVRELRAVWQHVKKEMVESKVKSKK